MSRLNQIGNNWIDLSDINRRNEIAIRHQLDSMSSDLKQALLDRQRETADLARLLSHLDQWTHQFEERINFLLNTSQEYEIRSDASLDSLVRKLNVDATVGLGHTVTVDSEEQDATNIQGQSLHFDQASRLKYEGQRDVSSQPPDVTQDQETAPHSATPVENPPADTRVTGGPGSECTIEQQADQSCPKKTFIWSKENTGTQSR